MNNVSFIDLFAGIGGFRLGLEHFGMECVFSSEIDKCAVQTYAANFGEIPCGDISEIKAEDIPAHEILCAGFPCQPFSISGKKEGFADPRGTLFAEILRVAKHHKPGVLFLENVANFASHDQGNTLSVVIKSLNKIGYDVYHQVLNASHFGIPTARRRIYFVCFRRELGVRSFEFPAGTNKRVYLRDYLEPAASQDEKLILERDDIVLQQNTPAAHNKPDRIGQIGRGRQGERIYSIEGHAVTFSASGGGPGSTSGLYLDGDVVRRLSPRECFNIMGFPKDFIIPVTDNQAYTQIGNSVCVPVIKEITRSIITTSLKHFWRS